MRQFFYFFMLWNLIFQGSDAQNLYLLKNHSKSQIEFCIMPEETRHLAYLFLKKNSCIYHQTPTNKVQWPILPAVFQTRDCKIQFGIFQFAWKNTFYTIRIYTFNFRTSQKLHRALNESGLRILLIISFDHFSKISLVWLLPQFPFGEKLPLSL